ncbi:Uncharacterised protein [uncultured archaeon]|nr:Uncharacterised protein [uncultured archaeon]
MTDVKSWEVLIGFAALIFTLYPVIKDIVTEQTGAFSAFLLSIIFSFGIIVIFIVLIKISHK